MASIETKNIRHWMYRGKDTSKFHAPHLVAKLERGAVCGEKINEANYRVAEYDYYHKWLCAKCRAIVTGNGQATNGHENAFAYVLAQYSDIPTPEREYRFTTARPYRFDFAWPDKKVAIEIDGMHHDDPIEQDKDREKRNIAAIEGWRVLSFSYRQLFHHKDSCIEMVYMVLRDE